VSDLNRIRSRDAARLAIAEGLTSKEAAYKFGHSIRAMLNAANRQGLSFRWSGYGRPPKFLTEVEPHKEPRTDTERALVDIVAVARAGVARHGATGDVSALVETLERIARMADREFDRIR